MRLVGLAASYSPTISSIAPPAEEPVKACFSKDFLGSFIEAPTDAKETKAAADAPFIKHKIKELATAQGSLVKPYIGTIAAFYEEVQKAPWWHWTVVLENLKSLFRTTKKEEVEEVKDIYISVPSSLEFAKIELEKLSDQVKELRENHLHNPNQIDLKAREDDYRIYLSAEKHIQDAYRACLAEIELTKKDEAAVFMEGFQAISSVAEQSPFLSSHNNEQLLITEKAEESINSIVPATSSKNNQIANKPSTPNALEGERVIKVESFAEAWERLKTFSRKGIELKSPESGLIKKAHDFIHHDTTSEVVATSSAVAHMVTPGSGLIVNGGATIAKSIAKGVMYSATSFRKVEYKNAFRMQLRKKIDFAIQEVEDMFSSARGTDPRQAAAAAGMAAGALDGTLKQNTVAMEGQTDAINKVQEEVKELKEENKALQRKLEGIEAGVGQLVQIAKPLLGRRGSASSIDSGIGLSRTSSPNNHKQASASPVITENMSAGQSITTNATSSEVKRPSTPELIERVATLEKTLAQQTELIVQERELAKQEREAILERAKQEKAELLTILEQREAAAKAREERLAAQFQESQTQQFNMLLAALKEKN